MDDHSNFGGDRTCLSDEPAALIEKTNHSIRIELENHISNGGQDSIASNVQERVSS